MRASLKSLHSPDVENLQTFQPVHDFGILVQMFAGPYGGAGEESFDFILCTPGWLLKEVQKKRIVVGYLHVIVDRYDYQELSRFLEKKCLTFEGDTWKEVATKLSVIGAWEFDDYRRQRSLLNSGGWRERLTARCRSRHRLRAAARSAFTMGCSGRGSAGSRRGSSQSANRGFFQRSTVPSAWTILRNFTPLSESATIAAFALRASHQITPARNIFSRASRCAGLHRPPGDFISTAIGFPRYQIKLSGRPRTTPLRRRIAPEMYVRPEARGTGLAAALVQQVIAHARTVVEQVCLTVIASNVAARRLYHTAGFEEYGLERRGLKVGNGYYDQVLMVLPLDPRGVTSD
jgi:GNAT superfamily N-acetyltransferase